MVCVVAWWFGMMPQRGDMIMKRGCDVSITIGPLTRSGKGVRVEGFAKFDPDVPSARPPCSRRKRFKASPDPDRNDWYRVGCHQQADPPMKRLKCSVARQSALGKPDQLVAA